MRIRLKFVYALDGGESEGPLLPLATRSTGSRGRSSGLAILCRLHTSLLIIVG